MRNKLVPACLILTVIYWVLESALDVLVAGKPSFITQLLPPDPNEVWMRLTIIALFISFGSYAQILLNHRRKMEEKVRSSEANLSVTLHSIGDAVIAADLDSRVTLMNRVAERLTGWSADEARGRPVSEVFRIVHEETREPVECPVEKVLREETVVWLANHTTLISRDGLETPIDDTVAPIKDTQGKVSGIVLVFHDITEDRAAQKALKRSEEKYRQVVENALGGIFVIQDEAYRYVNQRSAEIFGTTPDKILGGELFEFVHPDDRALCATRVEKRLRDEATHELLEHRIIDGSGDIRWVEVRGVKINWEDRPAVMCFVNDITERKLAEEGLKAEREKAQLYLDIAKVSFLALDREGRITLINRQGSRMLGYEAGELIGRNWFETCLPERAREEVDGVFQQLMRGEIEPVEYYENPVLRKDGEERIIAWHNTILRDQSGRIVGVLTSGEDVTDSKAAQATRERLESQLRQAKKMEALGTLAGGIAHDFNNILSAIIGYSELALEDTGRGVSNAPQIEEVIRAGERARELVTQILTFSRKVEPELKLIDLNRVIDQTERILKRTIPKMIEIEHHLPDGLWLINADQNQLSQVLLNLGANAGDAMPQGGRLVIETENLTLGQDYVEQHIGASPGDYVKLTVSDTGHGLDKATLEHIFDPFFTSKEVGRGTGLGLATVYGIVKSHGGYIMCYSEVGQGTTFKIYFPAVRSAERPEPIVEIVQEELKGGEETILLVDDEEVLREMGRQILSRQGYQVLLAEKGEKALELYRDKGSRIDLVLLDISMPGMGGHKCLQDILRIDPQAKVIIASGYSRNGHLKDTLSSGAAGFVPKPFSRIELLKTVREVLDG